MWFWIPTLIVFGYLQVGIRSNSLSFPNDGYVFTAGIGYHKVHCIAKTSDTARSLCQEEGGDLAIIDSEQESQIIVALFALSLPHTGSYDSNYALVGFHGRTVDVQCPTFQDENLESAVYDERRWNEPSIAKRETENCESIDSSGRLHGISCNQPYAFVCERPEYEKEICGEAVEMNMTVAKELIIEGGKISIACYVVGYPASRILWHKDYELIQTNDRINISGNELIIPKANKNDAGKYRCTAANKHKSGAHTVDIKVIVPVKVRIVVDDGPFPKGSEISIACNTDGYPTPTVQWYKNDNHIEGNKRINVVAHKLIISIAEKNDAGKYRCEAANEYTSSAETVDIRVAGTSEPLPNAIGGYESTPGIGCHKVHSLAETWDRARSVCKEEGGDLAIINSKTESEVIGQLFTSSLPHIGSDDQDYAHIGFNDRNVEGQYVTITTETLVEAGFNEWHENEPNNEGGKEDCGSIWRNGQLNDIPCDRKVAFVCERPQYEEIIRHWSIYLHGEKVHLETTIQLLQFEDRTEYEQNYYTFAVVRPIKSCPSHNNITAETTFYWTNYEKSICGKIVRVNVTVANGTIVEGGEVSLACNVSGYPAPRVVWYKNDDIIHTNDRVNISGANGLIISRANQNDTGKYRCEAANKHMSDAHTVDIEVTGKVSGKYCPPLRSESVDFDCKYHNKTVSCESTIAPRTRATIACKNFYKPPSADDPGYGEITCLENGAWNHPVLDCIPECGTEIADETQSIVHGSKVPHGRFPWSVRIHQLWSTGVARRNLQGILISPNLVLVTATSFYNKTSQKAVSTKNYVVVAGQFSGWYSTRGRRYYQKSAVKRIDIAPNWQDAQGLWANNVALIHVETPFSMTTLVRPICIDWENEFELKQRQSMKDAKKVYGWVPKYPATGGWENQEVYSTYIPREECSSQVPKGLQRFLKGDTFCVSCANGSATCKSGNYPFMLQYESHGIWYLLGVNRITLGLEDNFRWGVYEYGSYLDRIRAALLTAF